MNLNIVISGPSGAGKGTLINELLKNERFIKSVSCTTRSKRELEIDGKDYYFLSHKEFKNKLINNEFFEAVEYDGNFYGILNDNLKKQNKYKIFDVVVSSGINLKEKYPNTILIYILPQNIDILNNQRGDRGDSRLNIGMNEIEIAKKYDFLIINDTIESMIKQFELILEVVENNIIKYQNSFLDDFYTKPKLLLR